MKIVLRGNANPRPKAGGLYKGRNLSLHQRFLEEGIVVTSILLAVANKTSRSLSTRITIRPAGRFAISLAFEDSSSLETHGF